MACRGCALGVRWTLAYGPTTWSQRSLNVQDRSLQPTTRYPLATALMASVVWVSRCRCKVAVAVEFCRLSRSEMLKDLRSPCGVRAYLQQIAWMPEEPRAMLQSGTQVGSGDEILAFFIVCGSSPLPPASPTASLSHLRERVPNQVPGSTPIYTRLGLSWV